MTMGEKVQIVLGLVWGVMVGATAWCYLDTWMNARRKESEGGDGK